MRYRKKQLIVEAVQWTGNNLNYICKSFPDFKLSHTLANDGKDLGIYTLEGLMWASVGDYIIKGIHGEFYACKPDIFNQTYEEVHDDAGK